MPGAGGREVKDEEGPVGAVAGRRTIVVKLAEECEVVCKKQACSEGRVCMVEEGVDVARSEEEYRMSRKVSEKDQPREVEPNEADDAD